MSADLWQIVERCVKKDAGDRFASTIELAAALPPSGRRHILADFVHPAPARLVTHAAEAGVRPTLRAAGSSRSPLFWWQFHQSAAALVYWAMVWPAWRIRSDLGSRLAFFFALLAAVVVASNLRLHLWFSSRVYPEELQARRAEVSRWIRVADIAFVALLIVGGIALPETRAGWAAVLIAFGIGRRSPRWSWSRRRCGPRCEPAAGFHRLEPRPPSPPGV